ncbi:hypothetical protein ANOBCDAF_02100 [Pleomorphomonas sp. T1.2MG-36]|nr:hypothetical protein ANOBCDAF_02100 [Pleomorphomonas sp. T1.2MG-36]
MQIVPRLFLRLSPKAVKRPSNARQVTRPFLCH